jgi:hypothetical protein
VSQQAAAPFSHQTVRLRAQRHARPEDGVCVMELASLLVGEAFSDRPRCASRVVAALLRACNDEWDDARRQALIPYAALVAGTAAGRDVELARAQRCLAELAAARAALPLRRRLHGRPPAEASLNLGQLDAVAFGLVRAVERVDPDPQRRLLALVDELLGAGDLTEPEAPHVAARALVPA